MINTEILQAAKRELQGQKQTNKENHETIRTLEEQIEAMRERKKERMAKKEELTYISSNRNQLLAEVTELRVVEEQKAKIRTQATIGVIS